MSCLTHTLKIKIIIAPLKKRKQKNIMCTSTKKKTSNELQSINCNYQTSYRKTPVIGCIIKNTKHPNVVNLLFTAAGDFTVTHKINTVVDRGDARALMTSQPYRFRRKELLFTCTPILRSLSDFWTYRTISNDHVNGIIRLLQNSRNLIMRNHVLLRVYGLI